MDQELVSIVAMAVVVGSVAGVIGVLAQVLMTTRRVRYGPVVIFAVVMAAIALASGLAGRS